MATKEQAVLAVLGLEIEDKSGRDLYDIWKQGKAIEDILKGFMSECRKKMFAEAEEVGTRDEKGSVSVSYDDGKGYQKQARVSVKFNELKALDFLREKGMEDLIHAKQVLPPEEDDRYVTAICLLAQERPDLLDEVETVGESDLESAIYEGRIKSEDLENLVDRSVTYALIDFDKQRKE